MTTVTRRFVVDLKHERPSGIDGRLLELESLEVAIDEALQDLKSEMMKWATHLTDTVDNG